MDTTLRYVQQFGRSKRDNLKPTLLNKYHIGNTIDVYPFRMMDFGCFASTTDGLSGLLHNSEMTSVLQASLPEMIEKAASVKVRITKYDRRTGEVAFTMDGRDESKAETKDAKAVKDETKTEEPAAAAADDAAPAVAQAASAPESAAAATAAASETTASGVDLEPFQFTTSQPVFPEQPTVMNKEEAFSDFLDKEIVDIQKFLETVIKQPLSPAARKMLKELLQQTSIFRFTYTMQTAVDDFEPDIGLQLVQSIERALHKSQH